MNKRAIAGGVLGLVLHYATPSHSAQASQAGPASSGPRVELNTNFAGCIKPDITNYIVGTDHIEASLKIVNDTNFSEGPCVCRGGLYYFQVFPSESALPKGRAWMYVKSFYKADLAFGVLPLRPYAIPHYEKIKFPTFKNGGRPFAWYYIAIGCP